MVIDNGDQNGYQVTSVCHCITSRDEIGSDQIG
jgi:hypothetical protein